MGTVSKSIDWTDAHLEYLAKEWTAGTSATAIANGMATKFNLPFTKNSIIGKAHRLKLKPREGMQHANAGRARKRVIYEIAKAAGGCQFIIYDDYLERMRKGLPFKCASAAVPGSVYCQKHRDVATVKPKEKSRV